MDGHGVTEAEEIILQLDTPLPCQRCGGASLLMARSPHTWKNTCGEQVHGVREAVLCPVCDCGEPAAEELLALFAVDEQLDPRNILAFGDLLTAWVESQRHRGVDMEALTAQHEQWGRGAL